MAEAAFFHEASATVRFWVESGGQPFAASVGRQALHHRYRPGVQAAEDPLDTFRNHAADIEAAVHRRIAAGSREPVMLREYDLRPLDAGGTA